MYNVEDLPRRRWAYPRDNERNYVAALLHAVSAILTMVSLVHLNWFRIYGDFCSPHLALHQFLRLGYFESSNHDNYIKLSKDELSPPFSALDVEFHTGTEVLHCITPEVLNLMRVLVLMSMLCIFCSMIGFCLDVLGPIKESLRFIRRNGLPSTWAVLIVIGMVGVSYLVTNTLEYSLHELHENQTFHISYEYGVYTVTAAGAVSLLATACNLLQDPAVEIADNRAQERLLDEYDGLETFSVVNRNVAPPPPYSP